MRLVRYDPPYGGGFVEVGPLLVQVSRSNRGKPHLYFHLFSLTVWIHPHGE